MSTDLAPQESRRCRRASGGRRRPVEADARETACTITTRFASSVGLNPLTRPFDYLHLSGKLVLYAKQGRHRPAPQDPRRQHRRAARARDGRAASTW